MRQRGGRTLDIGPVALPDSRTVEIPDPPGGLLKETRAIWDGLWRSRVSTTIDLLSDWQKVTRWILYVDEFARLMRAIRKDRLGKGSQGQTVLNPLWGALSQVESALQHAETDLGIGPSARLKLGVQVMETTKSIRELLDDQMREEHERKQRGDLKPWEFISETTGDVVIDLDAMMRHAPTARRRAGEAPDDAA